jgi:hypothetical protein
MVRREDDQRVMSRARMLAPLLGAVFVIALGNPASAFGYRATRFDPNDRGDKRPDISSTTRKVWAASNGHSYLTVTLRTYEDLPSWFIAVVVLDSRGGPRRDLRMRIWDNAGDGHGCDVDGRKGAFHQHGRWGSCRVPLRYVNPNKRVRWKVISLASFDVGNPDYAPNDRGWYT